MITADLEDATRILTRVRSLSQKNFASEADLTRSEARVGVLTAQLRQSHSHLETARLDAQRSAAVLDKHAIRAPFGGVVVDRSAQPGEMISPLSAGGGFTRTGVCTIVDMEFDRDRGRRQRGVHRPGHCRQAASAPCSTPIRTGPFRPPSSPSCRPPTARRRRCGYASACKRKDPRILPDMAVKVTFLAEGAAATARKDAAAN